MPYRSGGRCAVAAPVAVPIHNHDVVGCIVCRGTTTTSAYTGIREGSFPRGKVASPRIPACAVSPRDPPVLDSRTNFGSVPRGHQEAAFSPGQSVTRRGFVCLPDAAVTGIVRRDDFRSIFPGIFTNSTKITTRSCRNCVSKRVKTR